MAPFLTDPGPFASTALYLSLGFGFGFALERAGFGDSRKLAAQFYLHDQTVLKVMFTAIVTAMLLVFWSAGMGWLDFDRVWVNPTYIGFAVGGGFLLGAGFLIGGYCPGTSIVAASTFKIDGMLFLLGCFIGIYGFGETLPLFRNAYEALGSYGFGIEFFFLGLPMHVEWAKGLAFRTLTDPYDYKVITDWRTRFWIGYDF